MNTRAKQPKSNRGAAGVCAAAGVGVGAAGGAFAPAPISVYLLRELLTYDPATGALTWKERQRHHCKSEADMHRWNAVYAGTPALTAVNSGYRRGHICGRSFYAHKVAWAMHFGAWPVGEIDHSNHDRQDNRIDNLTDCTHPENGRNKSRYASNTSGHTGVTWVARLGQWKATICRDGRHHYLGLFSDIEAAVAARNVKASELGFHENHGRAA